MRSIGALGTLGVGVTLAKKQVLDDRFWLKDPRHIASLPIIHHPTVYKPQEQVQKRLEKDLCCCSRKAVVEVEDGW